MQTLLLTRCLDWLFGKAAPRRARRADLSWIEGDAAPAPAEGEELPRGCGWFDSSQDLREGLSVCEQAAEEAAAQLPLAAWLEWQVGGCWKMPA
jgi:hypothetical protein